MSVTAVIPCYNAEAHLRDTLRAVRAQIRAPEEILVIDDGSSDGSVGIARAEGARVIETGRNRGPGAARNIGLQAARTPLVAFVDSDDVWAPDHLAHVVPMVERHAHVAVGWSRIEKVGTREVGGPSRTLTLPVVPCEAEVPFDALPLLIGRNVVAQSAVVARREALLAAGGYDSELRFSEDYDLWLRLASAGWCFAYTPRVTCRYRVHAAQVTAVASADAAVADTSWQVRGRLLGYLPPARRAALVPPVEARLQASYEAELRQAWRAADPAWLGALLLAQDAVPGGRAIAQAWRSRRALMPLWVPVHRTLRLGRAALRRFAAALPVTGGRADGAAAAEPPA